MAKIALITQKLTPEFINFAKALHFHRHEVMLITSAEAMIPDGLPFETLTYFKYWSALESLKLVPRLLGHSPTVWHFVFSDFENEKLTPAHWLLAKLANALPGRVVATSFFDMPFELAKWRLRPLLKSCDIVTAGTRESLMYLKRQKLLADFCQTEVLPPLQTTTEEILTDEHHDQDLEKLASSLKPFLIVPNSTLTMGKSPFANIKIDWQGLAAKINLVFLGNRPQHFMEKSKTPPGIYFVGSHLDAKNLTYLFTQAAGLFTVFDDLSEVELMHFHELCSLTKTPTLATPRQAEALPGFCIPKKNGWLLEKGLQSFQQLLFDNPELRLPQPQFDRRPYEMTDSMLNELNRLYTKVRHLKSPLQMAKVD